MTERFRPIWLLKALAYEVYYQTKRILRISGLKERAEVDEINSNYDALKQRENRYLQLLLGKYPDQAWAKKYVKAGIGLSVPGILAFHMLETKGLHSIWTNEANLADCRLMLSLKMPFTTVIRHPDGTPHAILVDRYSPRRREYFFHDTLGSFNTNYGLHYNAENCISEESLAAKNAGHPIDIMTLFNDRRILDLFRKHFRKRKHYWV